MLEVGSHDGAVKCLEYDSASNSLISGSFDKSIRIWNLENGASSELVGHKWTVTCVCCSDGVLYSGVSLALSI
jgi:ribosomal RNA-processing protein 9